VIADGIVAMEGNGPLNGTDRPLGKIVLADDPVAADASCTRLMGFEPDRVVHLREGSRFVGNASPELIDQVGEILMPPRTPFHVVPEFRYLQAFRTAVFPTVDALIQTSDFLLTPTWPEPAWGFGGLQLDS